VIGRRRQGKSTLSLAIARRFHTAIIIFDPNAQFNGYPVFTETDRLLAYMREYKCFIAVFRPEPGQVEEDFTALVEALKPYGNYALIVDEAASVQRAYGLNKELEWLMRQAPRDGVRGANGEMLDVSVIQNAHRVPDIHSLCRGVATDWFLFQTSLQRDLDAIEKQFGRDIAQTVPTLQRWHCVHVWQGYDGRIQYAIWRDPSEWYIRIGSSGDAAGTQPRESAGSERAA
jgi:hypothetical protein